MDAAGLSPKELLTLRFETGFVLTGAGRLEVHTNSPDRLRAPRMYLAGSASGNEVRFRQDVSPTLVETIERLVSDEPPLYDVDRPPLHQFWPPWCVALHDDEIAAITFASRLTSFSAEAGVWTVEHLRRRGYATAATAGWAQSPALQNRTLFYSTDRSNTSSRHVAERLNLSYLGATLTIA